LLYRLFDEVDRHELVNTTICFRAAISSALAGAFGKEDNLLQDFLTEFTSNKRGPQRAVETPLGLAVAPARENIADEWEEF